MLIDTHAHINFKAFEQDAEETIRRANHAGVLVVNVGTQLDTSKAAVDLAISYKLKPKSLPVYAVVGLHPVHTYSQHLDEEETSFKSREEKFDYEAYKKIADNPLVVGIGECGLDYYRLPGNGEDEKVKSLQKDAFVAQIKLAKELDKALVIHCRPSVGTQDAYEDILKILDEHFLVRHPDPGFEPRSGSSPKGASLDSSATPQNDNIPPRFEIHSFTGSPEIVQEFLKRGAYVGLNGIITFDKTGNMEKVVKIVPLERIVLETDSPYLTPKPHRGKRNEPAYVEFVAGAVADMKGVSVDEVVEMTTRNAKQLFLIP